MSKKYKIPLILIFILIILCVALLVGKYVMGGKEDKKPTVYSSILDNMDKYGYTLSDQDGKLYKDKFYELKDILSKEEIDYDAYSKTLAEIFVIDIYTMSTKINKYDIGGIEYVYESEKESFKNKVIDTIYDSLEDNSYGDRKQELPEVKEVTITDEKDNTYTIDDKKLDGKKYIIEITYEKDLGYDSKVEVITVKDNDRVYITELNSVEK